MRPCWVLRDIAGIHSLPWQYQPSGRNQLGALVILKPTSPPRPSAGCLHWEAAPPEPQLPVLPLGPPSSLGQLPQVSAPTKP